MKNLSTPGPWEVRLLDMVTDTNGEFVADCRSGKVSVVETKDMHNAKLVSAAPELYDALEEALVFMNQHNDGQGDTQLRIELAIHALNNAKGNL